MRKTGIATVSGLRLEFASLAPAAGERRTIVMLHEGLGCVAMWRDFPERLAERTGLGVLAYSRAGYGRSQAVGLPRPLSYMHDEAREVLPEVLNHWRVEEAIVLGHSDGASIAAIHAGWSGDTRLQALILMAPHFFVEQVGIDSIAAARTAYDTGDLRARLARYHGDNVDCAFRGWNDAWLDAGFRCWNIEEFLPRIAVPVLVIQGRDDEYGSVRQTEAARRRCRGPVEVVLLEQCGHSPQRDRPAETLEAIARFIAQVHQIHGERPGAAG